jgi:transporter family-2 protein
VTRQRSGALFWSASFLAFFISMANALQARVNGATSAQIDQPIVAAMVSVGGGFILSTVILAASPKSRAGAWKVLTSRKSLDVRPWQYFAGVGGGLFILGQTLIVPSFGVSIYIIAVVSGQTLASLFVDHWGIGPAGKKTVTSARILAVLFASVGVAISALGRGVTPSVAVAAICYGLAAGVATAVQYALNGRISQESGSPMVASALNFFMGFCFLTVLLILSSALGLWELRAPPSIVAYPELWLGGPLGMLFIASAALFVRSLGVLVFAVVSVLGQLCGAILLDVYFPAFGTELTWLLFLGLGITAVGVLAATLSGRAEGPL